MKRGREKQIKAYGCGDVSAGDSLRGSVEVVERGRLADLGKDLGTDTECYKEKKKETCFSKIVFFFSRPITRLARETTLNSDQVLGLLHTLDDSLNVQRPDTPKVDDLDLDTLLLLQQFGSLKRVGDHLAVGDDGDVGPSLFNLGLADRDEEVLGEFFLGHWELDTVEKLVLEETDLWTD